jgi:hypothetical protein
MNPVNFDLVQTLFCTWRKEYKAANMPPVSYSLLPKDMMKIVREYMMKSHVILLMGEKDKDFYLFDFTTATWREVPVADSEAKDMLDEQDDKYAIIANGHRSFILHVPEGISRSGVVIEGNLTGSSGDEIALGISDDFKPLFTWSGGDHIVHLNINGTNELFSIQESNDFYSGNNALNSIVSFTDVALDRVPSMFTEIPLHRSRSTLVNSDMHTFFLIGGYNTTSQLLKSIDKVVYDSRLHKLNIETVATYDFVIADNPIIAIPSGDPTYNNLLIIGARPTAMALSMRCYYFNTRTYEFSEAPVLNSPKTSYAGAVYIPMCNSVFAFSSHSATECEILDLNVPVRRRQWKICTNKDIWPPMHIGNKFVYDLINMQ